MAPVSSASLSFHSCAWANQRVSSSSVKSFRTVRSAKKSTSTSDRVSFHSSARSKSSRNARPLSCPGGLIQIVGAGLGAWERADASKAAKTMMTAENR